MTLPGGPVGCLQSTELWVRLPPASLQSDPASKRLEWDCPPHPKSRTKPMSVPPEAINTPQYTDALWGRGKACPYDEVIDVRSPCEFAEDHIPGAVNLPVLSDTQRAEV